MDYSPGSSYLIVSGNLKYICIYDVANSVLLKCFTVSKNVHLDDVQEMLNSAKMVQGTSVEEINMSGYSDDEMERSYGTRKTGEYWYSNRRFFLLEKPSLLYALWVLNFHQVLGAGVHV
jgi:hypothetical protein